MWVVRLADFLLDVFFLFDDSNANLLELELELELFLFKFRV